MRFSKLSTHSSIADHEQALIIASATVSDAEKIVLAAVDVVAERVLAWDEGLEHPADLPDDNPYSSFQVLLEQDDSQGSEGVSVATRQAAWMVALRNRLAPNWSLQEEFNDLIRIHGHLGTSQLSRMGTLYVYYPL